MLGAYFTRQMVSMAQLTLVLTLLGGVHLFIASSFVFATDNNGINKLEKRDFNPNEHMYINPNPPQQEEDDSDDINYFSPGTYPSR